MTLLSLALLVGACGYYLRLWNRAWHDAPAVECPIFSAAGTRFLWNGSQFDQRTWEAALIEMRVCHVIEWELIESKFWEIDPDRPAADQSPGVSTIKLRRIGTPWGLEPTARDVLTHLFPPGVEACEIGSRLAEAAQQALGTSLRSTLRARYFQSGLSMSLPGLTVNALGVAVAGSALSVSALVFSAIFGFIPGAAIGRTWLRISRWQQGVCICILGTFALIMSRLSAAVPTLHFAAATTALFAMRWIPTPEGLAVIRRIEQARAHLVSRARAGLLRASEIPVAFALDVAPIVHEYGKESEQTWRSFAAVEKLLHGLGGRISPGSPVVD